MRRFLCVGIAVGVIHWTVQFIAWSYAGAFAPEMNRARRIGTTLWNLLSSPILSLAPRSFVNDYFGLALVLNSALWGMICAALGGHLKTGQSWTGQNRPVGEPPQA